MKTVWTSGIEKDAKDEMKQAYGAATLLRKRLASLCQDKIDGAFTLNTDEYDCPNWVYKQADTIGYQRALKEVLSLIE